MHVRLTLLSITACGVLSGCVPLWQIELYNESGRDITVVSCAGPKGAIAIAQGGSKAIDLAMGKEDQCEQLSIKTTTTAWSYPRFHKLLRSLLRAPVWQEQSFPFGVFRAFARIDARGQIYMLLPPKTGEKPQILAPQPAGFPLNPQ
jgi:hypothetical protein